MIPIPPPATWPRRDTVATIIALRRLRELAQWRELKQAGLSGAEAARLMGRPHATLLRLAARFDFGGFDSLFPK
jgi:hypothetical protein